MMEAERESLRRTRGEAELARRGFRHYWPSERH